MNKDIRLDFNIDAPNERVMVVPNEYRENVMLTYQVKLIDFTREDRMVYSTLEKAFYTPNGDWVEVALHI